MGDLIVSVAISIFTTYLAIAVVSKNGIGVNTNGHEFVIAGSSK